MKYLVLASALALLAPSVHAAYGGSKDDDEDAQKEQEQKAPEEIPDFSNLNEYVYQPRTTLNLGVRNLSGIKAKFAGNGIIPIPNAEAEVDPTLVNVAHTYHDGAVGPDGRSLAINNGDGTNTAILANPDGKTNTYGYQSTTQVTPDDLMQFHDYSATSPNVDINNPGKRNNGVEVSVSSDMGKIGKHLSWSIFGGMSVNDIQSATFQNVSSIITTITDTYDLFGGSPIPAGTSSPSNTSVAVNDANGNQVIGPDGTPVTQSISNSGLIGNVPLARTVSTVVDDTTVTDHFKLHGAYFTFRVGPSLIYSFNDHLKFSFSAGPALIYAGSTYQVDEVMNPLTGDPIVVDIFDRTQKLVPAYYADATVEYNVSDRTGFYLGGVYQNGGSYLQTAGSAYNGTYTARVDFSDQNGLRTGLSFKF